VETCHDPGDIPDVGFQFLGIPPKGEHRPIV